MNFFSARVAALVLLSLSAVACSSTAADGGASSAAAQTGPQIEPGPVATVSADGRNAADALLRQTSWLLTEPSSEHNAAFKEWLGTSASEVHFERRGKEGVTYYFSGDVVVEGDIIDGSKQLVIEETYGFEWGPTYTTRLGDGTVPDTATRLSGIDVEAIIAIQHLAPGDTRFNLTGYILEGGDMDVGNATLDLRASYDDSMPELNIVRYTATATVTMH